MSEKVNPFEPIKRASRPQKLKKKQISKTVAKRIESGRANNDGDQTHPSNVPPPPKPKLTSSEKKELNEQEERRLKRGTDTEHKAGHVLEILEGANILDYVEEDFVDPLEQYQAAHIMLLSQKGKHNAWEDEENPTEDYLMKKEKLRLDKLKRDRGHGISYTFCLLFHATVIFNFVYSWIDSFKITIQDAKLQAYHLQGVYNCMEVIENANSMQFFVEIIHATMSACILFVETSSNACLCMGFVFAQAIHITFKAFQFFMQFRFLNGIEQLKMGANFLLILTCNIVAAIVVIQRFYDLTDRMRTRSQFVATNVEGGSMNDEIIYQNQSSFLQRKYLLRLAMSNQVYRVIKKIQAYTEKGLKPDYLVIYRELHAAEMALNDVDDVENDKLMKELKKANARRLKELENDSKILGMDGISGSFSKLFLVKL